MEQHEFDVEVRKNGEVKIHIRGVKGKRCIDYMEFFKQVIGPIKEQQYTHEYYEPDSKVRIDVEHEQQVHETES